jgi:DNA-binding Lrp family transcriptional regulator
VLGVSQPTVTRTIHKLEAEGYIKEYTIVPDFAKMGYDLMAFTFIKMRENLNTKEQNEFKDSIRKFAKEHPHAELIGVQGIGLKKDYAFVSFFRDYSSFAEIQRHSRNFPFSSVDELESFLVNLKDERNQRLLNLSAVANHLLTSAAQKEKPQKK